jgi:hypothetical protein
MRDFKRIKAWHRAHPLAIALHKRTRTFSRAGYARLKAQLTGAETIEIRKMVYAYRKKVIETPDPE